MLRTLPSDEAPRGESGRDSSTHEHDSGPQRRSSSGPAKFRRGLNLPTLSTRQFDEIRAIVTGISGIRLPDVKRVMVESRVRKRLRSLQLSNFDEYIAYLSKTAERETEELLLVDVVTTNKTDFFREPAHFDLLADEVVPAFASSNPRRPLRVWSAACSSGEEPYTVAMVLHEVRRDRPGFDFTVFGTDIAQESLERAHAAVYTEKQALPIPEALRRRYLLRSRNPASNMVRVAPEVRRKVRLGWLNLMNETYALPQPPHVIFCRNVLIYFERSTQQAVLERLCQTLAPGGWLFLGHSESVAGFSLPLKSIGPSAFRLLR